MVIRFTTVEAIELNILFDEGHRIIESRSDGSQITADLVMDCRIIARLVRAVLTIRSLELSRALTLQLLRVPELGWSALEQMKFKGRPGRDGKLYKTLRMKLVDL